MAYNRPLMAWLSGRGYYLKSPFHIENETYDLEAAWLTIDHQVALHEAANVKLRPFGSTWGETLSYLSAACNQLGRDMPGWSPDQAEATDLISKLGPPPLRCYAIYLITVENARAERCVYVGQTNATSHRFRAGHAAISKLHHPQYDGWTKRLYLAGIQVEDDDDHSFPIEWIHPIHRRQTLLDSIENRLIYDLQPELNTRGRNAFKGTYDLRIFVQNSLSGFLLGKEFPL